MNIRKWGYWLQDANVEHIAKSDTDLCVIDPTRDGTAETAFTLDEVGAMKRRPDGGHRLLLAYLSIGEAEDYRWYWRPQWNTSKPFWIGPENVEWKGNYAVQFWHPDWKAIIRQCISQIVAQGFDGLYLDKVDIYEHWHDQGHGAAEQQMVDFVIEISQQASQMKPHPILVFVQNGEELLKKRGYLVAIDGIAKEDLFYGQETDEKPTPEEDCKYSIELLQLMRRWNKPVLTVDYVRKSSHVHDVFRRSLQQGFVPLAASSRNLDRRTKWKHPPPEMMGAAALATEVPARRRRPIAQNQPQQSRNKCMGCVQ